MTTATIETNYDFGYEETYQGRLEFFNETALWNLMDWFTQPLKDYGEVMTEDEKVDFIQNKLMDAYSKEVDYRYEETDQECLYDVDHVVIFKMKNKPEILNALEEDDSGVYAYHHAADCDGVYDVDKDEIMIEIINEWDSFILSRETYSERMIENFCSFYGFDMDDVMDKTVSIKG